MATYRVGLMQQIWEECTVTIEADTPEKAEELAIKMVFDGDVEWQFCEANEPPQIGGIEEVDEDVEEAIEQHNRDVG